MVHGASSYDCASSKVSTAGAGAAAWEKTSAKRSGYEAVQRRDKQKQEASKYGAWGSTFKNKDNFASMHHC